MTPKEKAERLIKQFIPYMYCYMGSGMLSNDYDEKVALKYAKQCALIAVDEILKNDGFTQFDDYLTEYWQQVKQEIELL